MKPEKEKDQETSRRFRTSRPIKQRRMRCYAPVRTNDEEKRSLPTHRPLPNRQLLCPLSDSNSLSRCRERVRVRDICVAQLSGAPHIRIANRREQIINSLYRGAPECVPFGYVTCVCLPLSVILTSGWPTKIARPLPLPVLVWQFSRTHHTSNETL